LHLQNRQFPDTVHETCIENPPVSANVREVELRVIDDRFASGLGIGIIFPGVRGNIGAGLSEALQQKDQFGSDKMSLTIDFSCLISFSWRRRSAIAFSSRSLANLWLSQLTPIATDPANTPPAMVDITGIHAENPCTTALTCSVSVMTSEMIVPY